MHVFLVPVWFNYAFPWAVFLLALCGTDWRARAIAGCQALMLIWGFCIYIIGPCRHGGCYGPHPPWFFRWRILLEDPPILITCFVCAWRARRYWVVGAASVAVLVLANDLARLLIPHVSAWASVSANVVFNIVLDLIVAFGAWPGVWARAKADWKQRV